VSSALRRLPSQAASTPARRPGCGRRIMSRITPRHLPRPRRRASMRVDTYSHPGRHVAGTERGERGQPNNIADVCLIVEGAYPYVSGGVSSWVHGLIRRRPDLSFSVVAILPEPPAPAAKYGALPNVSALHHLYLSETHGRGGWWRPRAFDQAAF